MTTAVPQPHDSPHASPTPPPESTEHTSHPSRRKLLARIGCGALTGGLIIGGGFTWAYGPGGPLSYSAKQLRKLKDDPMGKKEILNHKSVRIDDSPLPKWFEWKYPGTHLRRWFKDDKIQAKELMNQFIDYAEHHGWANDPGPTTSASWAGRHGGSQPVDDMFLAIYLASDDSSPPPDADKSIVVLLCYF